MNDLLATFLLLCVVCSSSYEQGNNVCKTFLDYFKNRERNPNCYHNPDMYLSVPEIINRHGYPLEIYTVTTLDGYILRIFRIPHGKGASNHKPGTPVFIQHGIGVSSIVFVNIGRKSLAFILADNGYDVWLGNFRGCQYSDRHEFLSSEDERYWNFTFHENGVYDLPAQIDFIAQQTQRKIIYVGYSMGTTAYFVYNSEYPQIAQQRIMVSISLAPLAFVSHVETPLRFFIPLWPVLEIFLYNRTNGGINQRTPSMVASRAKSCLPYPINMNLCQLLGMQLFGFDYSQEDPETLPVTVMQDKDAIAIKTLTHYIQLIQKGRFQQYDYGKDNKIVYSSSVPPQYNLSKINVPNYFMRANSDPLATKKNVEELYLALPQTAKPFSIFLIPYSRFSHADFVTAKDVKELVYDNILKFIKDNVNPYDEGRYVCGCKHT